MSTQTMERIFDVEWQEVRWGFFRGFITGEEARKRQAVLLALREITRINRRRHKAQS